ncbi:HNH endonuclease family protein, partial [Marinobacter sp.]|uniref:HNH endonuclease family protein n=1 Tax=Marinobacter sp. TaxID=50741 RepID=UPI00260A0EA8
DESTIKAFLMLLWQVRFQFDKWVVKWVEYDDSEDPQLRLTSISRSNSKGKYYINRTATDLSELVQLQAVLNFTGDRSAHYWLTALLASLVAKPNLDTTGTLAVLEQIDNQLSLTTDTQKEASYSIAKGESPTLNDRKVLATYFDEPKGTRFEHYWFQKLEYLLWKQGEKSDERLRAYRITSKNSVEHVHPQNEEYKSQLPITLLNAFGNLVLLSPGENSSYSNQSVLKKKADFDSKPRYDSLKLKSLFDCYTLAGKIWGKEQIVEHQKAMLDVLIYHYTRDL